MMFNKEVVVSVLAMVQCATLLFAGVWVFTEMVATSVAFLPEAGLPGFYLQYDKITHLQITVLVVVVVPSAIALGANIIGSLRILQLVEMLRYKEHPKINVALLFLLVAFCFFYAFITPVNIRDIPYNFMASDGTLAEVAFWQWHIYLLYLLLGVAFVFGVMVGWNWLAVRKWLNFLSCIAAIVGVAYAIVYDSFAMLCLGCIALILSVIIISLEKRFGR